MAGTVSEQVKPSSAGPLTLEAWSQGFMVGALIIMCGITLANMRRGILLHKLILIEVRGPPNFIRRVHVRLLTIPPTPAGACCA